MRWSCCGALALARTSRAHSGRARVERKRGIAPAHTMQTGEGMYSKARIAGHPIHPMLVAFPLAFYTTTVVTLLVYIGTREAFWFRFAMVASLAGIATAVIAAIPGAVDL